MNTRSNYLILFITVCMQVASSTNVDSLMKQNDLGNFDHQRSNITQEQNVILHMNRSTQQKPQKRITPIMFAKPFSDNDTCSNSQDDFPNFFTDEQRKQGAIILSFLVAIYCFTLLAIVCNDYFLPCVERICEALNLSQDVAAATFMAMATSSPELFVNIIGTFVTESDIGIGAVVGSSMFNTLGVGALGSLAATGSIQLDWWPVTRDCTIYVIALTVLVIMTWDGLIYWYEALVLFIMYFLYFAVMFNNNRISTRVRKLVERCTSKRHVSTEELAKPENSDTDEQSINEIYYIGGPRKSFTEYEKAKESGAADPNMANSDKTICYVEEPIKFYSEVNENDKSKEIQEEEEKVSRWARLFRMPQGSCFKKFFFFYSWPIKVLLCCCVPNPKTYPKLFPVTFIMCILLIGANSYIISWMITIIGHTFSIPDAILGLTFLAAGGSLPEAMALIIMSRKGEGGMGISNALGANTMNILQSLGLPWFVKTLIVSGTGTPFIEIASGSIEYTILGLMLVISTLVLILYFRDFKLSRRTGVILIIGYLCFLSAAIAMEMILVDTPDC